MGKVFFFVVMLMAWIGFGTYHWSCEVKNLCEEGFMSSFTASSGEKTISLNKNKKKFKGKIAGPTNSFSILGDGITAKSNENITFALNGYKAEVPMSVKTELGKVKSHLVANKNSRLNIIGHYSKNDKTPIGQVNLGLARANNIKSYLLKSRFNAHQITTNSTVVNNPVILDKRVIDGVSFSVTKVAGAANISKTNKPKNSNAIVNTPKSNSKTKDVKKIVKPTFTRPGANIIAKPFNPNLKIYKGQKFVLNNVSFKNGSHILNLSSHKELNSIVGILKRIGNINVEIGGHSQSLGNAEKELNLSKKRAKEIRYFLMGKGIKSNRLTVKGYGNTNSSAQNLDNRIEITIK